jgi:hypothetical protein
MRSSILNRRHGFIKTDPIISVAEQLIYSVYRLSFENAEENWESTGFFYKVILPDGLQSDLMVTAKHCIENASHVSFTVRRWIGDDPIRSPSFVRIRTPMYRELVVEHDEEDLAAILTAPYFKKLQLRDGRYPLTFSFGQEHIPNDIDCDAIMQVVMAGAPIGQYDEFNNHAIVRQGITASHPGFRYQGKNQFLVDIAAHEGSSGSPIFSWGPYSFNRSSGEYELHLQPHCKLVGILSSGLEIDQTEGQAVLSRQHAHLGVAVRANALLALAKAAEQRIVSIRSESGPLTVPFDNADGWTIDDIVSSA